jgi:serine/tyrosine/threonine adenylyltransferase
MQPDLPPVVSPLSAQAPLSIVDLRFHNRFVDGLPGDASFDPTARQTAAVAYALTAPTPVAAPKLLHLVADVAAMLELNPAPTGADLEALTAVLAGNQVAPGMRPFAACYGGHQFGNWAGQLGDGRAMTLAEVRNAHGESWELQLKGAGPTPYSRRADGRAVLRSSLRELVASEAMHHLGIPTTRALSLVGTGDRVLRDILYDGNAAYEPGAVVGRVAPSFLRFGNFELPASRRDFALLRKLVDYTISNFYPHLEGPAETATLKFFAEVCQRTAKMMVGWLRVGFVHGVMNTDNMSILGLSIDFGPYGFLEPYDRGWTPNTTDAQGKRYRYGNQAKIAVWNLAQLGNALIALGGDAAAYQTVLSECESQLASAIGAMHASKLGLGAADGTTDIVGDAALYADLEQLLEVVETDTTIFFRQLAELNPWSPQYLTANHNRELLLPAYYAPDDMVSKVWPRLAEWLARYGERVRAGGQSQTQRKSQMNAVNPLYVPRNHLLQLAIDAMSQGDSGWLNRWMDVLRNPYTEQVGGAEFSQKRPEWARNRPGCSMLSCSS